MDKDPEARTINVATVALWAVALWLCLSALLVSVLVWRDWRGVALLVPLLASILTCFVALGEGIAATCTDDPSGWWPWAATMSWAFQAIVAIVILMAMVAR